MLLIGAAWIRVRFQSVRFRSTTNYRASGDYASFDNFNIGASSLWHDWIWMRTCASLLDLQQDIRTPIMVELYVNIVNGQTARIHIQSASIALFTTYVQISIRFISFLHSCSNLIEARLLKRGGNIWTRKSATDDSTTDSTDVWSCLRHTPNAGTGLVLPCNYGLQKTICGHIARSKQSTLANPGVRIKIQVPIASCLKA